MKEFLPIGFDLKKEIWDYARVAIICIMAASLVFIGKYNSYIDSLYVYEMGKKVLIEANEWTIIPFSQLIKHRFYGLTIYGIICFIKGVGYYKYYLNSKSIYIMRRTSKSSHIFARCSLLPFMALIAGIILALILFYVYRTIYLVYTPSEFVVKNDILKIWEVLL